MLRLNLSNLSRLYNFRRTLFYGVAYVIVIAHSLLILHKAIRYAFDNLVEIKKPQRFAVVKTQIVAPRVGFEPTTLGLEVLCSIQLSYQGVFTL